MIGEALPLPPGLVPLTGGGLEISEPVGRVGDGLVYAGRDRGVPARLREYAPAGIVTRALDGTLRPAAERYADALAAATGLFVEQGRRLAGFSHPGIAPVWRTESAEGGGAWLVGAPTGAPLSRALDAGVVFTPAEVVRFAGELADVLAELHWRGLTHLDIAPETVSTAFGKVQLSDFAVDNRPFIALLHGHEGLVRPGYSAIEHYDAGMEEPLGAEADVHAASALLYRLVTGWEPAPWQERWRNPKAAPLADRDDYPPGFLAAIHKGMAIEPGDRFPDAATWRAALSLPRRITPQVPAVIPPEPERRRRGVLAPLLVGALLLVIGLLGFLAWQFHWLVPNRDGSPGNVQIPSGNSQQPPPRSEPVPIPVRIGDTVNGQLSATDAIGPDGGYRDQYRLDGHRGDRIALGVASRGFDPLLTLFGSGLPGQQGEGGRLTVVLPQDGSYTIMVAASRPGTTGDYSLEVVPAPEEDGEAGPVDPAAARRLAGSWHDEDDEICKIPAVNSVQGDSLIVHIGPDTFRHRIEAADGDAIDTVVESGPLAGRRFSFRLSPDGDSYDMDGETWTRC